MGLDRAVRAGDPHVRHPELSRALLVAGGQHWHPVQSKLMAARGRPQLGRHGGTLRPVFDFAGWTTVASIVNVACAGVALQWDGSPLSPSVWSAALICIAGMINLAVMARRRDPVYPLVFVWAAAA